MSRITFRNSVTNEEVTKELSKEQVNTVSKRWHVCLSLIALSHSGLTIHMHEKALTHHGRFPALSQGGVIPMCHGEPFHASLLLFQESNEAHYKDKETGAELEVIEKMPLLEWLANSYKKFGCQLEFVTNKSQVRSHPSYPCIYSQGGVKRLRTLTLPPTCASSGIGYAHGMAAAAVAGTLGRAGTAKGECIR